MRGGTWLEAEEPVLLVEPELLPAAGVPVLIEVPAAGVPVLEALVPLDESLADGVPVIEASGVPVADVPEVPVPLPEVPLRTGRSTITPLTVPTGEPLWPFTVAFIIEESRAYCAPVVPVVGVPVVALFAAGVPVELPVLGIFPVPEVGVPVVPTAGVPVVLPAPPAVVVPVANAPPAGVVPVTAAPGVPVPAAPPAAVPVVTGAEVPAAGVWFWLLFDAPPPQAARSIAPRTQIDKAILNFLISFFNSFRDYH